MTTLILIKRNVKLFFKDKGMFLTSLITPAILLVLYATFLGKVYCDSLLDSLPEGFALPERLINGLVGGELASSILAVSCITVAFCSNFLMVQDKANGTLRDLRVAPLRSSSLALSYYAASLIATLIIALSAAIICFIYVAAVGWYMTALDVLLVLLDILLCVLFGTALSSVINCFLSSQGQISAVGTIVSAGYGFISGAYMPISSFGEGLQKLLMFLPGTYGTSLLRDHAMRGAIAAMNDEGVPSAVTERIKESLDCALNFFGHRVPVSVSYLVLIGSIVILVGAYVLINFARSRRAASK